MGDMCVCVGGGYSERSVGGGSGSFELGWVVCYFETIGTLCSRK